MLVALALVLSCGSPSPEGPVPGYRVASSDVTSGEWTNRLVAESSPYLLQHARNPVDWYPWGDEAFEAAQARNVPVFLSIGYAACHWCHVMEEETFEDPAIAAVLNERFVPVKVDREERPDIDDLYMDAVVAFSGGGGWPASVWLTPDGVPFYAGTYFPPEARFGRPGFADVLDEVHERWTTDPDGVARTAADIRDALEKRAQIEADSAYPLDAPAAGIAQLDRRWDPVYGGWGNQKFPLVPTLELLLAYGVAHADDHALGRVRAVLDAMDRGGIHDHLGGGFHRYTVDRAWVVPHFEKMADDNAQLLRIYAEAAVALNEPRYAEVARGVAAYVLRDLRSPDGTFYASQDADAGGVEGATYTWTVDEVRAVLPEPEPFLTAYEVTEQGNHDGTNVLVRPEADASDPALVAARAALLEARAARAQPRTDTTRVVATNGLIIGAFARAGRLLDEPEWVAVAQRAAGAVLASRDGPGGLPRTLAPGAPAGVIDDYAWLAEGLLDLYEADHDPRWLAAADAVARAMVARFLGDNGAFHVADAEVDDLLVRKQEVSDGARPSGAGRAVAVLWRLSAYGAPAADAARVQGLLRAYGRPLRRTPGSVPSLLMVVDGTSRASVQAVVASDGGDVGPFIDAYDAAYRPYAVSAVASPAGAGTLAAFSLVEGKAAGPGGVLGYVCFDGVCKQPTGDPAAFRAALDRTDSVEPAPGADVP